MLFIHPVLMACVIVLLFYVLLLGLQRFRIRHMGIRGVFAWKRHVRLGRYVMLFLLLGGMGGGTMALWRWEELGNTGIHYAQAWAMLPLIVAGYLTGHVMDADKRPRKALPLVHMVNNLLLCVLAVLQIVSGYAALQEWVL